MTTQHDCQALRAQLFDYRLGELSALDRAAFEERAAECAECHLYVHRIIEMLDLASSQDAWVEDELAEDPELPERMFAQISDTLGFDMEPQQAPATILKGVFGEASAQDEEQDEVRSSGFGFILSAAALLLVGLGGALGYHLLTSQPQAVSVAAPVVATKQAPAPVIAPQEVAQQPELPVLGQLTASTKTPQSLKVFASKEAKWKVNSSAQRHVLTLERGTVLVEFLPTSSESLKVVTQGSTVEVTGTVFYVSQTDSKQRAEVGVLTGEVKVKATGQKQAPVQTLTKGQRLDLSAPTGISALRAEDRAQPFVDLTRHETLLATRKVAPRPAAKRPARAPSKPSIGELSAQARQALMEKHYERAATLHERLLKRLGSKSKTRATVRLELANLYLTHLNQRSRAIGHLKRFVYDHPYDVATPSARTRLCRLLGPQADSEPACGAP